MQKCTAVIFMESMSVKLSRTIPCVTIQTYETKMGLKVYDLCAQSNSNAIASLLLLLQTFISQSQSKVISAYAWIIHVNGYMHPRLAFLVL